MLFTSSRTDTPNSARRTPQRRTNSRQRLECGEIALHLTRIFECVAPSAESQRDSATKPRVARKELPWENARHIGDNPERVVDDDRGNKTMPQPRWGCESSVALPRGNQNNTYAVRFANARSSQPWAELHNPFGIEDAGREQELAPAFLITPVESFTPRRP